MDKVTYTLNTVRCAQVGKFAVNFMKFYQLVKLLTTESQVFVPYFKVISQYLPGKTNERTKKKPQLEYIVKDQIQSLKTATHLLEHIFIV
jgi:hypothetical protein